MTTPSRLRARQQRVFEPGDVSTMEAAVARHEDVAPVPEVLLDDMFVEAVPNDIALPNIDRREIVVLVLGSTDEDVDARASKLGTRADLGPSQAGKCNARSRPVQAIDDLDALGVSMRNEDSNGEGFAHHISSARHHWAVKPDIRRRPTGPR